MGSEIIYTNGDAIRPVGTGNKIIVHISNGIGGWGKGFIMAISKRRPAPQQQYRQWYQSKQDFALGEVQFVPVEPDIWVANMIGQHRLSKDAKGNPPIRYNAVEECLNKVAAYAKEINASVHMPRIGCGLAGGTWDRIEPLIESALQNEGISVTVYDF